MTSYDTLEQMAKKLGLNPPSHGQLRVEPSFVIRRPSQGWSYISSSNGRDCYSSDPWKCYDTNFGLSTPNFFQYGKHRQARWFAMIRAVVERDREIRFNRVTMTITIPDIHEIRDIANQYTAEYRTKIYDSEWILKSWDVEEVVFKPLEDSGFIFTMGHDIGDTNEVWQML